MKCGSFQDRDLVFASALLGEMKRSIARMILSLRVGAILQEKT